MKDRAVVYLRTSTDEQNPEKQKKDCLSFAEGRGYTVVDVLQEKVSAYKKKADRPEYEKVKRMAHRGEVDAVIVWALDRWVRNRRTLLQDVTVLKGQGVKLHSVREDYLEMMNIEGPIGDTIKQFLLGLIGSLSELESRRKSERVRMAYKNHKGRKWGRPCVHTNRKREVLKRYERGETYREIQGNVGFRISLGKISEIINEKKKENKNVQ